MIEKQKLIIVTAGSRGIGAAIVKELVRNNYKVIFTYRSNKDVAESLVSSLNENNQVCSCYPCDVMNVNEVEVLCRNILDKHGTPYGIIHNAGISKDNLLINTSIENWHTVINTNLSAGFYFNHYLLDSMMLEGDGCIINISSTSGFRGFIGQTSYSASKAGQIGLTKSLAREAGIFNIRVNCIAPGLVETDLVASLPKKLKDLVIKHTALRKAGKPEDIALMATFLLGEGGRHITGQTLVIDGGFSI